MCTIKINECWRNFVSEENGENLHSIRLEGSQVSSRIHAKFWCWLRFELQKEISRKYFWYEKFKNQIFLKTSFMSKSWSFKDWLQNSFNLVRLLCFGNQCPAYLIFNGIRIITCPAMRRRVRGTFRVFKAWRCPSEGLLLGEARNGGGGLAGKGKEGVWGRSQGSFVQNWATTKRLNVRSQTLTHFTSSNRGLIKIFGVPRQIFIATCSLTAFKPNKKTHQKSKFSKCK